MKGFEIRNKELIKYSGKDRDVSIPSSVTSIRKHAFLGCDSLESVTIPNSVTFIDEQAFCVCRALKRVTIPSSVEEISIHMFSNCGSLTSIDVAPESKCLSSIDGALYDKSGKVLIRVPEGKTKFFVPDGVECIYDYAFSGCQVLESVTIPSSVVEIYKRYSGVFLHCHSLTSIEVAPENRHYSSIDGALYDKSGKTLLVCPEGKTQFSIPDGVKSIDKQALRQFRSLLKSVTIPASVKFIDKEAFCDCDKLTEICYKGTSEQWSKIANGIEFVRGMSVTIKCSNGVIGIEIPEFDEYEHEGNYMDDLDDEPY